MIFLIFPHLQDTNKEDTRHCSPHVLNTFIPPQPLTVDTCPATASSWFLISIQIRICWLMLLPTDDLISIMIVRIFWSGQNNEIHSWNSFSVHNNLITINIDKPQQAQVEPALLYTSLVEVVVINSWQVYQHHSSEPRSLGQIINSKCRMQNASFQSILLKILW